MALPLRAFLAIALVYAYFVTSRRSALWYAGNFLAAAAVQCFGYALWAVILYPKLFSPLKGLPEPSGNSWLMGQWSRIVKERSGGPMSEW